MQIDNLNPNQGGVFGGWFAMVDGGGEGVGKITPCLTLVRTMQEAINLAHKYTHRFSLQKYTF